MYRFEDVIAKQICKSARVFILWKRISDKDKKLPLELRHKAVGFDSSCLFDQRSSSLIFVRPGSLALNLLLGFSPVHGVTLERAL